MKKRLLPVLLFAAFSCALLSGCCLKHEWEEATCYEPKSCEKCGKTEGEPLEHEWKEATCTAPKTCELCNKTKGNPLEHEYAAATCNEPQRCEVCGEERGEALGHDWIEGSCDTLTTCSRCGETTGEVKGHEWYPATLKLPIICKVCGETEGEPLTIEEYMKNPDNSKAIFDAIDAVVKMYEGYYSGYTVEFSGNSVHYTYEYSPLLKLDLDALSTFDWSDTLEKEKIGFESIYGVKPETVHITFTQNGEVVADCEQ